MKKHKAKLLVVEDDNHLGIVLKDYLELENYKVTLVNDGEKGIDTFNKNSFDICLLDVMLPVKDGYTLASEIREKDGDMPIIFLTAKSLPQDKIKGLEIGADDYITKPFNTHELTLRIDAILRRSKQKLSPKETTLALIGTLVFDFNNQVLKTPSGEKRLTKKESEMLYMLYKYKNQILPRKTALKTIWGEDDYFMGRSMDVYITKLRKLLKEDPSVAITNVHNTGFKLEDQLSES